MPDTYQIAVDRAVQVLRDAGASTCSVMASWPDGASKTKLAILQQAKPSKALGRNLSEIQNAKVPAKKLLGNVKR